VTFGRRAWRQLRLWRRYNAEIRGGNFYGAVNLAQVTVVVSELIYMDRIKNYYDRAVGLAHVENKGE